MNTDSNEPVQDATVKALLGRDPAKHAKYAATKIKMAQQALRGTNVTCDACGAGMSSRAEVDVLPDGGERQYLHCHSCDTDFEVALISQLGVQLRREMNDLRAQGKGESGRYHRLSRRFRREVTRPVRS